MPTSRETRRPKIVRDLMTTDVITIEPDAPVSRAVELLADSHVSGLAVVDHHDHLIGVISTTDIVNAEAEMASEPVRDRLWSVATVRDIMTRKALPVAPDLELREAALQMDYADVHRLFVMENDRLIGVISRSDINRAFAAGTLG
jgi:CBS domain-containing protein